MKLLLVIAKLGGVLQVKLPELPGRHDKLIFQHDNPITYVPKSVEETLDILDLEVLLYPQN